jgi:hypothetical protein
MTLTIGRFTTAAPFDYDESGDMLTINGDIMPTSDQVNSMTAARVQLLGMVDGDVLPVTSTEYSTLDGYYRVSGVVQVTPLPVTLSNGTCYYSISLERVANGYARPALELVTIDTYRATGSFNPGTSTAYVWLPTARTWAESVVALSRTTDSGAVGPLTPAGASDCYGLAPSDHYDGAATIEFLLGSTWWPLQGKQVPSGAVDAVRIGNGLTRLTWRSDGDIEIDAYASASWGSAGSLGDFRMAATSNAYTTLITPASTPTVLRNDVEVCALRFPTTDTSNVGRSIDISIRRGELSFVISTAWAVSAAWTIGAKSTAASTAITASLRQTSNGAGGHRFVLMSPNAHTNNTTDGRIYNSAVTGPLVWGIGVELAGSSAATPNTAAEIEDQWWHAMGVRQRVIAL